MTPEVITTIVIGLVTVISTLTAVIVVLNKRLGPEGGDKNNQSIYQGSATQQEISHLHGRINDLKDAQNVRCATQLSECNKEFKSLAVGQAEIATKVDNVAADVTEIKNVIKGNGFYKGGG